MWQYSLKGSVLGISGDVDMNISYKDYPASIRKQGLNGFCADEKQRFNVSAIAENLTEEQADMIMRKCSELGMTVVRRKTNG